MVAGISTDDAGYVLTTVADGELQKLRAQDFPRLGFATTKAVLETSTLELSPDMPVNVMLSYAGGHLWGVYSPKYKLWVDFNRM